MKSQIRIGQTTENEELTLDVEALVDSRMVIEANSGGGKSYFMRLLAERTAQAIPFIILDYEGEFSTLREKLDLVLVGTEGEIAADTRSAKLLARKLIETEVSAVIDLYELRTQERQEYASIFLDALINLPRNLWKPYLIFIDEAHKLCPERGDAKATSTQAVIDLMSLGGKRGFCGILATQRFSKLHNNALAEANNFFIGRTVLDADQKRAGDYLGMTRSVATQLRDVERGHFYAFGPALSFPGVAYFQGDRAETTHLRGAQRRKMQPPKPSKAIQAILNQFEDLPQKAQEEARSLEEAQARILELQHQVKKLEKVGPATPAESVKVKEVPVLKEADLKRAEAANNSFNQILGRFDRVETALSEFFAKFNEARSRAEGEVRHLSETIERAIVLPKAVPPVVPSPARVQASQPRRAAPAKPTPAENGDGQISKPHQRILDALAWFESVGIHQPTRSNVAAMTGVSPRSSGFEKNISTLRAQLNLIDYPRDGCLALTDAGRSAARAASRPGTIDDLHQAWLRSSALSGPQREMLQVLIENYPTELSREQLAEALSRSVLSSGFEKNVSTLSGLGLVTYPQAGYVIAAELLFPAELTRAGR